MESGDGENVAKNCKKRKDLGSNSWIVAEPRARDRLRWREDVVALCATCVCITVPLSDSWSERVKYYSFQ